MKWCFATCNLSSTFQSCFQIVSYLRPAYSFIRANAIERRSLRSQEFRKPKRNSGAKGWYRQLSRGRLILRAVTRWIHVERLLAVVLGGGVYSAVRYGVRYIPSSGLRSSVMAAAIHGHSRKSSPRRSRGAVDIVLARAWGTSH